MKAVKLIYFYQDEKGNEIKIEYVRQKSEDKKGSRYCVSVYGKGYSPHPEYVNSCCDPLLNGDLLKMKAFKKYKPALIV